MNTEMMKMAVDEIAAMKKWNFVVVDECEIVTRADEQYALTTGEAYLLNSSTYDEDGNTVQFIPVILEGRAFFRAPDEGRSGVLHFQHWTQRKGNPVDTWYVSWLPCRYMHRHELDMTNAEILENIIEEVIRGETPLTGLDSTRRG